MSWLLALLGHLTIALLATSIRLRVAWAYTVGTRVMPVSELWPILIQEDRDWLRQAAAHFSILKPVGARLPGGMGSPALVYEEEIAR